MGQDNKIVEISVTDETNIIEDSGVQLTPTSTKCNSQFNNDVMNMLITISKDMNEQKNKFDKLSSDVSEVKSSFDIQNSKFDVINSRFDEINTQNAKFEVNMNKRLNEMDECFDTIKDQILESISSSCEKKIDEMNKNLERKFNQILNKKLDDKVIVMTNIDDDKIVEEVVLDNKVLSSDDNDVNCNFENIVEVVCDKKVVETNVCQLVKECDESLDWQRACLLYTSRCV